MNETISCQSVTITTSGNSNRVEFAVQYNAEGPSETVSLSVIVPPVHEQSLQDAYKQATLRAIEILQKSLKR